MPVAWKTNRAREQRRAVDALERSGAVVLRDFERLGPGGTKAGRPAVPEWLRRRLGDEYFGEVKEVRLYPASIFEPGPDGVSRIGTTRPIRDADVAPWSGSGASAS